jgi:AraC family transcriptional regulator
MGLVMQLLEISATSAPQGRSLSRAVAPVENDIPRVLRFFLDDWTIEIVVSDRSLLQALHLEEARLGTRAFDAAFADVARDAVAESLIRALAAAARDDIPQDAIISALVVRALAVCRVHGATLLAEKKALLPKWRLKRVVDHVDAHLDRRVTLADMAAVAGLTRMYFAVQFRRTTGMSPHGYLLRRRVERAQELMRDPSQPLAQIALSVGFGTQPHFTTVFKRLVGQTPYRWRQNVELQTQQA